MQQNLRRIFRGSILLTLLFTARHGVLSQERKTAAAQSEADVKVAPIPDPPSIKDVQSKSDLVVRAKLIRTRTYKLAGKLIGQARFVNQGFLKGASAFPLQMGEEFSVTFQMKPDELGPFFAEPPEDGDYVLFLELKNVKLGSEIVGAIPQFLFPNPFAMYEPTAELLKEVGGTH